MILPFLLISAFVTFLVLYTCFLGTMLNVLFIVCTFSLGKKLCVKSVLCDTFLPNLLKSYFTDN